MDDQQSKMRMERIERLLYELKYEITRGVMEREIEEQIGFEFLIPSKRGGEYMVHCHFRTFVEDMRYTNLRSDNCKPNLKLVD